MEKTQEYLTGNIRIRYPFADDSVLSSISESSALAVFGCFVDAYIQMKSPNVATVPKVTNISMSGNALHFDLEGRSSDDVINLTCTATNDRFTIIPGESDWCWFTFVMSSSGIKEFSGIADDIDISSDKLEFNKRCIGYSVLGVSSLKIYGGEQKDEHTGKLYTRKEALLHEPDRTVTGDISIQSGYNISFSGRQMYTAVSGVAAANEITINAIPGEGLGRLPCECADVIAYKTPGLLSNDGHTRLFNDTCYDLVPVRYSQAASDLKINAKCKACCTCEMYASIVNDKLVPLKNEILRIQRSIKSAQTTYEKNVKKWNDRLLNAQPEDIFISMTGVPLEAAATKLKSGDVSGKMSRCGFSAAVRNDSFVEVAIEFSGLTSNGDIFEKQISYVDESLEPRIIRFNGNSASVTLPPGRSATMTCFIRSRTKTRTDSQTGFMAYVTITARQGERTFLSRRKGLVI